MDPKSTEGGAEEELLGNLSPNPVSLPSLQGSKEWDIVYAIHYFTGCGLLEIIST